MIVTIAGNAVAFATLQVSDQLDNRSVANFTVIGLASDNFQRGQSVTIYDDANQYRVFGGSVYTAKLFVPSVNSPTAIWTLACVDNHADVDRRIVAKAYAAELAGDIVMDMVTNYLATEGIVATRTQPTFARNSITYDSTFAQIATNVARYETLTSKKGVWVEEAASNLLTANQASVETDTTGFQVASGATISRVTTDHVFGAACLKVVCPATAFSGAGITGLQAPANATFTASVYAKGPAGKIVDLQILDTDNAGAKQDSNFTLTGGWDRIVCTYTIGANNATNLQLWFYQTDTSGSTFYLDGLQLEQNKYVTTWKDGGTNRVADSLSIPSANVINVAEGTVAASVYVNATSKEQTKDHYVFSVQDNAPAFVGVSGTNFVLNGNPFQFVGFNAYDLVTGNNNYALQLARLQEMASFGARVVRTWAFGENNSGSPTAGIFQYGTTGGLFNEATFVLLDNLIAAARVAGVRLALCLSNNWGDFGGKPQYVAWYNAAHATSLVDDNFHDTAGIVTMFKTFINKLITRTNTVTGIRYVDDPTIFSWEIINEGRYTLGTDTNQNTLSSTRLATMKGWYQTIADYIRSLDPNHLIGSGGISQSYKWTAGSPFENGTYYGLDLLTISQLTNINYLDYHLYPANDYNSSGGGGADCTLKWDTSVHYHTDLATICGYTATANKPLTMGEFGIDKRNTVTTGETFYPRGAYMDAILGEMFGQGLGGALLWNYDNPSFPDNNFGIDKGVHYTDPTVPSQNAYDTALLDNVTRRNTAFIAANATNTWTLSLYHAALSSNWHVILQNNANAGQSLSFDVADSWTPVGWHVFAVRWNASEVSLWIDGVKRGYAANSYSVNAWGGSIFIGSANGLGHIDTALADFQATYYARSDAMMANYASYPAYDDDTSYLVALNGSTAAQTTIFDGVTINNAVINYAPASDAIQSIADKCDFYWIVDAWKVLKFGPRTARAAPFPFNAGQAYAGSSVMRDGTINLTSTAPQYRNTEYLLGGQDTTATQTEIQVGDGQKQTFALGFPLAHVPTISVSLSGGAYAAKTVGIKGIDTGKDWYWQANDNNIYQDSSGTKLTSADKVKAVYTGYFPIVVYAQDHAAVNNEQTLAGYGTGIVEVAEVAPADVVTQAAGFQVANATLQRYTVIAEQLEFETFQAGLRPGQIATAHIAEYGVNGAQYLIQSVDVSTPNNKQVVYKIVAIAGPASGSWIEFFKIIASKQTAIDQLSVGNTSVLITTVPETESWTWSETVTESVFTCPICGNATLCGNSTIVC